MLLDRGGRRVGRWSDAMRPTNGSCRPSAECSPLYGSRTQQCGDGVGRGTESTVHPASSSAPSPSPSTTSLLTPASYRSRSSQALTFTPPFHPSASALSPQPQPRPSALSPQPSALSPQPSALSLTLSPTLAYRRASRPPSLKPRASAPATSSLRPPQASGEEELSREVRRACAPARNAEAASGMWRG